MKNKNLVFMVCLVTGLLSYPGPYLPVPSWVCPPGYAADIQADTPSPPAVHPEHSKKISMDFQDAALVDVLKIFSQQTDLNLITSEDIAGKRVTVYLDNVAVDDALKQVLRANNLTYEFQSDSNIYIVKPIPIPELILITRVYQLQYAIVDSSRLKTTFYIETERSDDESTTSEQDEEEITGITTVISGLLTSHGIIREDPRTNSLIIKDIPDNFPQIEQAIAKLDVPVVQILIELEMLEVTKDTADLIGIKFGSTFVSGTGGTRETIFPWNEQRLRARGRITAPSYTMGTIDASKLTATLQFLMTRTDTKTLARPKILTLNNETAQIRITTDEAIGSETITGSSEGTSTQSVQAERVETGVSLTVTPQANPLTREIIMAVVPKVTIARVGGEFGGVLFHDPEERTSQSILRVQNGDTIIIGGLLRTDTSKIITKIPILGDIPLIGMIFRHKNNTVTNKELIIFITPHIVDETFALETASIRKRREATRIKEIERALSIIENRAL